MSNKNNGFSEIAQMISLAIFLSSVLLKPILIKVLLGSSTPLLFMVIALVILLLGLRKSDMRLSREKIRYIFVIILSFLPILFRNDSIENRVNIITFVQFLVLYLYCIVVVIAGVKDKPISLAAKIINLFAFTTSVITIMSIVMPSIYFEFIERIFTAETYLDVKRFYELNNAYSGLTEHYSKNAFYVLLGIVVNLFFNDKNKNRIIKRRGYLMIAFYCVMLLIIGKRGHLIFMAVVLLLLFLVKSGAGIKTYLKIIGIGVLVLSLTTFLVSVIPQAKNTFNRFSDSGVSGDITTGRAMLYEKAFEEREERGGAIGWGQFSRSTNYKFAGVHNDFIQLYVEVGVLMLFVVFRDLYFLWISLRGTRRKIVGAGAVLTLNCVFLLLSLTEVPHYSIPCSAFYLLTNTVI